MKKEIYGISSCFLLVLSLALLPSCRNPTGTEAPTVFVAEQNQSTSKPALNETVATDERDVEGSEMPQRKDETTRVLTEPSENLQRPTSQTSQKKATTSPEKSILSTSSSTKNKTTEAAAVYQIPNWNVKTVAQKFPQVLFGGNEYTSSSNAAVPGDKIGILLAEYVATGYDDSKSPQTSYQASCSLYSISGISKSCAVAARFSGTNAWLPYINTAYKPMTLGDFIRDLNLHENLQFNHKVMLDTFRDGTAVSIEYTVSDSNCLWNYLLVDTDLKNVVDSNRESGAVLMSCSIDVRAIGQRNISMSVTENGFLTTNILDSEKRFFVGRDIVNRFVAFVQSTGTAASRGNEGATTIVS